MPNWFPKRVGIYLLALSASAYSLNCGGRPAQNWSPTAPSETSSYSATTLDQNAPNPDAPAPEPTPEPTPDPNPNPPAPNPTPDPTPPDTTPTPTPPPLPPSLETTLIGAGDVDCAGGELTARIIERYPNATVFANGDLTYHHADYKKCYDPSWGRFKYRTRPAFGNHDDPKAYFEYFGASTGPPLGVYSYNLGSWHIIVLNSVLIKSGDKSVMEFLKNDLRINKAECSLAYAHHPLFSSGIHGASWMDETYEILDKGGVEVVLSAHDHFFEAFGPQDARGNANPQSPRQFTGGTGGSPVLHKANPQRAPNSLDVIEGKWGVFKLDLGNGAYSAQFIDINNTPLKTYSGTCSNPFESVPNNINATDKSHLNLFKFTPAWR